MDPTIKHAPLVINGRTIPVSELHDIKDMGLVEGLQAMLDRGYFGEYPPGTNLFEVFDIKPDVRPITEAQARRYAEVVRLLEIALDLEARSLDSTEARRVYERALRDHDMLSKLEQP